VLNVTGGPGPEEGSHSASEERRAERSIENHSTLPVTVG
jgi:hypothetical protein